MDHGIQGHGNNFRQDIPSAISVVNKFCERVKGKTFVITGTSEGSIGAEAAKALAWAGEPLRIFLLARSESKVAPVVDAINRRNKAVKAMFVAVNLMDFSSIRRAAAVIRAEAYRVDIMLNFAGVFLKPKYVQSPQRIEQHFATNHLGHFLLTKLLFPALLMAGPGARVVQVTSQAYAIRPFELENYNFRNGATYHPWDAVSQANTACILFAREAAVRMRTAGHRVSVFAANPGYVPESNLNKHLPPNHMQGAAERSLQFFSSIPMELNEGVLSLQQGPASPLIAALDPVLEGRGGYYVSECKVTVPGKPWAVDDVLARNLWALDEQLIGDTFLSSEWLGKSVKNLALPP